MIVYDYITKYLNKMNVGDDKELLEMERLASLEDSYVPIADRDVISLIKILLSIKKPTNLLEIGTGVGYSAACFLRHQPNLRMVTIERYQKAAALARENFQRLGLSERIILVEDDAANILPTMEQTFDFIFLDAAKGQYLKFLPHLIRILNGDGLLFSDNVLYKGMTAHNDIVVRRKITIVKRLREYINTLMNTDCLETSLLPVGDGVCLSVKKP